MFDGSASSCIAAVRCCSSSWEESDPLRCSAIAFAAYLCGVSWILTRWSEYLAEYLIIYYDWINDFLTFSLIYPFICYYSLISKCLFYFHSHNLHIQDISSSKHYVHGSYQVLLIAFRLLFFNSLWFLGFSPEFSFLSCVLGCATFIIEYL